MDFVPLAESISVDLHSVEWILDKRHIRPNCFSPNVLLGPSDKCPLEPSGQMSFKVKIHVVKKRPCRTNEHWPYVYRSQPGCRQMSFSDTWFYRLNVFQTNVPYVLFGWIIFGWVALKQMSFTGKWQLSKKLRSNVIFVRSNIFRQTAFLQKCF